MKERFLSGGNSFVYKRYCDNSRSVKGQRRMNHTRARRPSVRILRKSLHLDLLYPGSFAAAAGVGVIRAQPFAPGFSWSYAASQGLALDQFSDRRGVTHIETPIIFDDERFRLSIIKMIYPDLRLGKNGRLLEELNGPTATEIPTDVALRFFDTMFRAEQEWAALGCDQIEIVREGLDIDEVDLQARSVQFGGEGAPVESGDFFAAFQASPVERNENRVFREGLRQLVGVMCRPGVDDGMQQPLDRFLSLLIRQRCLRFC
jgi:hypothetical protein